MNFLEWMAVLGVLLLILALASAFLRWLPITTSLIYLGFGVLIGQLGIGLWEMEFLHIAGWMEHLTEVAVLVSLFVSGLKLRMPLRHPAWKSAYVLAGPVMLACIGGVTLLCHYVFGLSWGAAVLIGAILAPTDPVLASLVQVNDARDSDRLRYGLSGEAGFNDGTAFPFVVFGLMLIAQGQLEADWVGEWALHRLLWAVPAGLLIGFLLGKLVGRVAIYLRARHTDTAMSPNDSLALALIALAYVGAELAGAWGFLAVFAAGLGLRHAEIAAADDSETPSEELINDAVPHLAEGGLAPRALSLDDRQLGQPRVAAGVLMGDVLAFGGQLERSLEVLLVTMLGVLVSVHWDWRAVPLGLALFLLIRPLSVMLLMPRRYLDRAQCLTAGWFGIRGIGSLYYLSYAVTHGLLPDEAQTIIGLVLSVVALSIVLHGLSTQPLLRRYERSRGAAD
ncbi:sodium/hydrogen exchanger family protein [Stutzerimonas stutzeri]|uniref:cation:proton antiporter n=1 Tax=Stutzerimonas stutzeri subgroup TaxID=578833 RepID=UPI000C6E748A|nr:MULTISPECIES: sodium:proton antiporter [Stutzerimonas stutzeri subgroup]MCQ2048685.1 sodium:proton antiporter [Stutzerimonas kunmingensis]PKR25792.1 sodium:proton antiporter [Stutzerimonas stutzeri]QQC11522.1 sodium:proton antiporter [Stutzerimonas stutzeri]VEI29751.1 sodium/hydrogen exchanger family protein [Stutzerimonas stutzeri]